MSAPTAPASPQAAPAPAGGKSGMLWKVIVLCFIVAVIGGECLFALMYVSSVSGQQASADDHSGDDAESTADEHATDESEQGGTQGEEHPSDDHGEGHAAEKSGHGEHGKDEKHGGSHDSDKHGASKGPRKPTDEIEVDLGEYSLTAFQAASSTTLMINFHLYGTIAAAQEGHFLDKYEANVHRIREQVIMTVRSAEVADLTDPGLGLIKRQILEKTNRALGKVVLKGIIFSDFLAVEQ